MKFLSFKNKALATVILCSSVSTTLPFGADHKVEKHLKTVEVLVVRVTDDLDKFFNSENRESIATFIARFEEVLKELRTTLAQTKAEAALSDANMALHDLGQEVYKVLEGLVAILKANKRASALGLGLKLKGALTPAIRASLEAKLNFLERSLTTKSGYTQAAKQYALVAGYIKNLGNTSSIVKMNNSEILKVLSHRLAC